jgi:hypothetical protein
MGGLLSIRWFWNERDWLANNEPTSPGAVNDEDDYVNLMFRGNHDVQYQNSCSILTSLSRKITLPSFKLCLSRPPSYYFGTFSGTTVYYNYYL